MRLVAGTFVTQSIGALDRLFTTDRHGHFGPSASFRTGDSMKLGDTEALSCGRRSFILPKRRERWINGIVVRDNEKNASSCRRLASIGSLNLLWLESDLRCLQR